MKNSKTVLIDKNPGRNCQTFGIARILDTDLDLIHEPSIGVVGNKGCLLYTSPSPRDLSTSRMPSSA